jgi:hypothetical protein
MLPITPIIDDFSFMKPIDSLILVILVYTFFICFLIYIYLVIDERVSEK